MTGLPIEETVRFGVRARDIANQTDTNSVMLDATPTDEVAPSFDGLVSVSGLANGTEAIFTLSWKPASDYSEPISYLVYEALSSGAPQGFPVATLTGATTVQLSNRIQGRDYFYIVRAQDAYGNSDNNSIEWKKNVPMHTGAANWELYD